MDIEQVYEQERAADRAQEQVELEKAERLAEEDENKKHTSSQKDTGRTSGG
jgi:hypothetical protein